MDKQKIIEFNKRKQQAIPGNNKIITEYFKSQLDLNFDFSNVKNVNTKINKITNYGVWYLEHYFNISSRKLLEALFKKFFYYENYNLIIYAYEKNLKHLINEEQIINDLITTYISNGKDFNYIITNLLRKKFNKDFVLKLVEDKKKELGNNRYNSYLINKKDIEKKVLNLLKKGEGKNKIILKLSNNEQERKYIQDIIENIGYNNENILKNKIKEYIKNKNIDLNDFKQKQKLIKHFLNKGFTYKEIKDILN